MSDVASLPVGHWHWSGWLTPKGRVIALFALLRYNDESVWLILQDSDPAVFVARLQRFVFRSKVAINVPDHLQVHGAFRPATIATGASVADVEAGVVEFDMSAAGGQRRLLIAVRGTSVPQDDDALASWRAFDLVHGLPRLDAGQVEQWTPQQLSLDRLKAFSVKKGCYPGQEIVARTHFLGQAKRTLVLLGSDVALATGDTVSHDDRSIGSIVSSGETEGTPTRHLALAVLPVDHPTEGLSSGPRALQVLPLQDGLSR